MGCGGRRHWRGPDMSRPIEYGSHRERLDEREAGPTDPNSDDPMVILKRRLARGEITLEEYQKLEAVLKG